MKPMLIEYLEGTVERQQYKYQKAYIHTSTDKIRDIFMKIR